ncbi:hypothetical protein LEWO105114_06540 [Legionella worsleiensis]|nr:Uncharacterised protein [Legionella worsleiensis]
MVRYRREYTPGATYFFTLTLLDRQSDYLTLIKNGIIDED